MELTDVVVVAAKRSPMGLFGGSMKDLSVLDIGSQVIKKTLESIDLDPKEVDMTVFGNCRQAGNGTNPARIAAELAGIPIDRFAQTVNCACPTGIKATIIASQDIRCGDGEIIVAGGMESMSTIPHLITGHRWEGFRLGDVKIMDGWNDTIDKIAKIGMGLTAENVAEKYDISREDQDEGWRGGRRSRLRGRRTRGGWVCREADLQSRQDTDRRRITTRSSGRNGVRTAGGDPRDFQVPARMRNLRVRCDPGARRSSRPGRETTSLP